MKYNYHTHTYRCGHATGTEREYIENQISIGIKKMGFSEHIPFVCPNGEEEGYRLPKAQEKEYIDAISALRYEYKEKIEIYIGYETEYMPESFDEMVRNAKTSGAQYLILGQHSIGRNGIDLHWVTKKTDDEQKLKEYVDCIVNGMKSGYISFVAHPDIFNFIGDINIYREQMRRICVASNETDTPLEINLLGIRQSRSYPKEIFWEIAGFEKCKVVFGYDIHDVSAACDTDALKCAEEIVKKYNLTFLEDPELKLL